MQQIDVNEVLSAFSLALDIAENKTFGHAQRTAYIALRLSKELGVSQKQLKDIYAAALLHDIGMVSSLAEAHTHANHDLLVAHCTAGQHLVKSLPISAEVSEYICWHHANWNGSGPFCCAGKEIPLGAQIVYLADQLELRLRAFNNLDSSRASVTDFVKEASGSQFCPEVAEAFLSVQEREVFWLDFNHHNLSEILARLEPANETKLGLVGLEQIADTFARIIDDKSPFTHEHSHGVAALLALFTKPYAFDEETASKLKISGLLHDLGKLAVPNTILDKPGKLTAEEFQLIKSHSYYTKLILSKVKAFDQIKEWAGNHHETLDGKGYPEGLPGGTLSRQDRMVAVCDVYMALTEERPYRSTMPQSKAFEILDELVAKGKVCPEIVADLKRLV